MENGETAFPIKGGYDEHQDCGLTKREYIATRAMQSLILKWHDSGRTHSEITAKQAVEYAEKLINELNSSRTKVI